MERKEDLTLTNKQMLVAQLRKEQEQNRTLRKELENAKREQKFAEAVKQAQIDVLNELKEKFKGYEAWYYNGVEEGYHDLEEEIDELIKEIEDDKEN